MKTNILFLLFILIAITACKQEENATTPSSTPQNKSAAKTNAEISIAQGGQWEGREYKNRTSFKNVTHLKVPKEHTDHSYYLRYEGPGWESNKVGYRLYLDWRNAIDVYGKKTEEMVLAKVGQDGFDSYHEMSDWGMDILKVGKSLGLGSYGRLIQDSVHHFPALDSTAIQVSNNTKYSDVQINYYGWQTDDIKSNLSAILSIEPDSHMTTVKLSDYSSAQGLVTGIVKHPAAPLMTGDRDTKWNYIATYGKQSLVPDNLGMVIFYKNNDVKQLHDGKYDHLIEFKNDLNNIQYAFAALWEKEKDGINSEDDFIIYINNTLSELNL